MGARSCGFHRRWNPHFRAGRGGVQFRSSRRWEPHGAANSTVPLWAFALQPFFSSFSGFLSPMLSRPVTKVVSRPEPCPSRLAFSCSSQPLLCPAHIQDLSQAGSSVVGCETSALVSDSPDLNLCLPASSWVTPASYLTSPGLSFLICVMETATSIF